jgi:predicted nuclease of predicted toxin-antitoxin system
MDVNVQSEITDGLRRRGVDVLTSQEDGTRTHADSVLLDRAGELGRLLFTRDADFLEEAARRQRGGESFTGIIYARQRRVPTSICIDDLELIAKAGSAEEFAGLVQDLPLR